MKAVLIAKARDLDAFCAKLNGGLTAVAVLLAFAVMTMSVVRVQQTIPGFFHPLDSGYELSMGQL